MENLAKTKVCSIFEPTYRSIMTLPTEDMQLRMFISLCDFSFDEKEPQFGSSNEERLLAALWEQFRIVFVQAKKRARINALNGAKGGRPSKASEVDGLWHKNPEKPTGTNTNTYTEETSASDYDWLWSCISENLSVDASMVFSSDLVPNLAKLANDEGLNREQLENYIHFVADYSTHYASENKYDYFYSVVTKLEMFNTFLKRN